MSTSGSSTYSAARIAVVGGVALVVTAASIIGWRQWANGKNGPTNVSTATTATAPTETGCAVITTTVETTKVVVADTIAAAATSTTSVSLLVANVATPTVSSASNVSVNSVIVEETKTAAVVGVADNATAATSRRVVYIMRGVPGSGKSTLAKQILEQAASGGDGDNGAIFSTDDFFAQSGTYKFNPKQLGNAHQWNFDRTEAAMRAGRSPVIIDNTNTQRWEARGYVEAAIKYGYDVVVREPDTPWARDAEELAKRNTHGVNLQSITAMLSRWDVDFSTELVLKSERPQPKIPAKRQISAKAPVFVPAAQAQAPAGETPTPVPAPSNDVTTSA